MGNIASAAYAAEYSVGPILRLDGQAGVDKWVTKLNDKYDLGVISKPPYKNAANSLGGLDGLARPYVRIHPGQRTLQTVLHEYAHAIAIGAQADFDHQDIWARLYVDLVEENVGVQSALRLRSAFDDRHVLYARLPQLKKRLKYLRKYVKLGMISM